MYDKIFKDSLERNWVVTIIYQKGEEITQRNIEVKSIENDRILAYCHLRRRARVFGLDHILAADYCRKSGH